MKKILMQRKITLFVLVILVLFSVFSYSDIPKQESPNLTAPYAVLTTIYPGASIKSIEELVTRPIEHELFGIDGYDYSSSYTSNNVSVVVLALQFDSDLDKAYDQLADKMNKLQSSLPEGCGIIDINDSIMDTSGLIISISSDNYTYNQLAEYAKTINDKISRIDGIRRFDVVGAPKTYVEIKVKEDLRSLIGISYNDLSQLLAAQTMTLPLGELSKDEKTLQIAYDVGVNSIEDINNIIVGVNPMIGTPIYLKDISEINEVYGNDSARFLHNGKKAVILAGYFQQEQNILNIGKEVKETIDDLKKELPEDLIFAQVSYLPDEVDDSINEFLMNLGMGVLLVILVVFIGMGFRNAIIVSVAIPVSILLTVLVMPLFSIEIHQISIAACIVALGMLVDNAIVVSDAIQVEMDLLVKEEDRKLTKEEKIQSAATGTKAVMVPVLTSTLTTIAAFSPLLLLTSIAGAYVEALPAIVILSLIASYIVAIIVTPALATIFFKANYKEHKKQYRIRSVFSIMLKQGLKHKFVTLFCVFLIIVSAVFVALQLNIIFFPKVNKNVLYIDVEASNSRTIDDTEVVMNEIYQLLEGETSIDFMTTAIGSGIPRFYDTLNVYTPRHNFGQIYMQVTLDKDRFDNNTDFLEYIQSKLDGSEIEGVITVKELEYIDPRGSIIGVRISGEDDESVDTIAGEIRDKLATIEGTLNINDSISQKVESLEVLPDKARLAEKQLYNAVLQNELNIALMGRSVGRFGDNDIDIQLISDIDGVESLEMFSLTSGQESFTLKDVASIETIETKQSIKKYDNMYSVYVGSDVTLEGDRGLILSEIKDYINQLDTTGVTVVYEGENEKINEYFGEMGILAIYTAFAIYLILLIQFKSFIQPLVILSTIPLAAIGSVVGLYLTQQPVSFTAMLGVVSLMGIVVNNAIVLLDFIGMERRQGKSIQVACGDAVRQRFRPIMLSTITTIIGLIPLATGESELFRPMAVALMSGLIVSTLLTLVIIPIIYSTVIREQKV